jgi:hypothetical protein
MSIDKKSIPKPTKSSNRIEFIKQIERERNSKVICYITGDRDKFSTKIGNDVTPIFFRHLELIGNTDKIDLFLYTRGGEMVAPFRIVKLIRSYCNKFGILIPYKAQSAGTLIALGADEIIMTKLGELTPVDPTTGHPFNPRDSKNNQIIPISVEDITSYLLFAKDKGKLKKEKMDEIFENLTKHDYHDSLHLHPLALGNVYRVQRMIRKLSEILLSLHINVENENDKKCLEKIIDEITSDICIHNYPIYRDEAKKLGLNILLNENNTEKIIWSLFKEYEDIMKLKKKFNPLEILGNENIKKIKYGAAYIESIEAQDVFYYDIQINKTSIQKPGKPPTPTIGVNVTNLSWEKVR